MITAKKYKVTLGAAPVVKVVAGEAKVAWKLPPTAAPGLKDLTVSGSTVQAGNVYCFV
jgi:hypothetical protein